MAGLESNSAFVGLPHVKSDEATVSNRIQGCDLKGPGEGGFCCGVIVLISFVFEG